MTTKKLTKYVAKRATATRDNPTAPQIVLGFVKAGSFTEAAESATLRWGCEGENELIVLVPLDKATETDIQAALLAEADAHNGPSFGKRRKVQCGCGSINYIHPRIPLKNSLCLKCARQLYKYPWEMVDMALEFEALKRTLPE